MHQKYTFFISSTFSDLIEERQVVAAHILDIDEIPIGMEQFGSIDVAQWLHITRLIDTCDYLILIIAGRYGQIDASAQDKLSFTHKEFRYARDNGIPVIAILHSAPEQLPSTKCESDPIAKQRLQEFREEVKSGRLVSFYKDDRELLRRIAAGISKAKAMFQRPGWIRNVDLLQTVDVREHIDMLQNKLKISKNENIYLHKQITDLQMKLAAATRQDHSDDMRFEAALKALEGNTDIPITWIDGSHFGTEVVTIPIEILFTMIATRIYRGVITNVTSIDDALTDLTKHLVSLKMKEFAGEGTKFRIDAHILTDVIKDLVRRNMLLERNGSYFISQLGMYALDIID
jgi:hypothetical protein